MSEKLCDCSFLKRCNNGKMIVVHRASCQYGEFKKEELRIGYAQQSFLYIKKQLEDFEHIVLDAQKELVEKDARIKELEGLVEKAILKKDFSNYSSFLDSLKKNGFSFFIAMDMGDSIEYQIYNDIESKEEEIKSNYDLLCACENIAKAYGERIKELGIQQEIG